MAIAYRAVPLAEVCYIFEAIHWLAIGRLPEIVSDRKGDEARISKTYRDDYFSEPAVDSDLILNEDEVSTLLPSIEYSSYLERMFEKKEFDTPEKMIEQANFRFERFTERVRPEHKADLRKGLEEELARAEDLREFLLEEKTLNQRIEQARAKIFIALSEGSLKASGYALCTDKKSECEYYDIPSKHWSLDGISWSSASIEVDGVKVTHICVQTKEMISVFPQPDTPKKSLSGNVFGSTFLADSNGKISLHQTGSPKPRGRPRKGDGMVEIAVRNEYKRLLEQGELSNKMEANLFHMANWANNILGVSVSRTSLQRWLKSVEKPNQK